MSMAAVVIVTFMLAVTVVLAGTALRYLANKDEERNE